MKPVKCHSQTPSSSQSHQRRPVRSNNLNNSIHRRTFLTSSLVAVDQLLLTQTSSAAMTELSPRRPDVFPAPGAPRARTTDPMSLFRGIAAPIDRYLFLRDLSESSPADYYQLLLRHTEEVLPFIYTPTVGEACQNYHRLPLRTAGLYINLSDRGRILERLQSWPRQDVRVAVVTDGERILGLGDLGANGMGISEGKITLYTAAAGVSPLQCLPLCLDVGTNNTALREDPLYKGLRQPRITGEGYHSFVAEFMDALRRWQPHMLLQFEDFGNTNAFKVLEDHRRSFCCFNDDIQGTAAICLSALLASLRVTGASMADQRVLFLGAGEAGTGIGELVALYLSRRHGMSLQQARRHCYFLDSKGLVCASRTDLQRHKQPFAHDVPPQRDLKSAIRALRPTALIGVSTIAGAFDQEVVEAMTALNDRPIIFPLSNPTSKSECTYEQAFRWSGGKVLFASGSPFDPITSGGVTYVPAQANNAYIFPAVGHAAVLLSSGSIEEDVFLVAAEALAEMSPAAQLQRGRLFPPFADITRVSARLTARLIDRAVQAGEAPRPVGAAAFASTEAFVTSKMWRVGQLSAL